ncbi:MAG: helix-turn-helix domain-containing protein [Myxococcales bacterium]|nr:helix-turn-helix domain-containing protein [Myxococcales bacterium]
MAVAIHAPDQVPGRHAPPIPGFLVQAVLRVVQNEGIEVPNAPAPLPSPAFGEPADFSIPSSQFKTLLKSLAFTTGEQAVGLRIGQQVAEPNLHVFGPVITASRTMRDAHSNCLALCNVMRYTPNGRLEIRGREARYVMVEASLGPVWEDIVVALCFHAARRFHASTHVRGDMQQDAFAAYFMRPAPADPDAYRKCFDGRVHFQADITGCGFPSSFLDLPRPGTDASLAAELREVSARRLKPLALADTWSARVESALRGLGDLSQVDFQNLSTRWGISQRTLRRRLAAEGTSVGQVLEDVRFDRALFYLQETDAPISKVAEILGYSEATSFRRAFKRWSGNSPHAHRARYGQAPARTPAACTRDAG